MEQLKSYTVSLIRAKIINVDAFAEQRNGVWTLTKEFAGIPSGTAFQGEGEMYDRVATGLVHLSQQNNLRVAS